MLRPPSSLRTVVLRIEAWDFNCRATFRRYLTEVNDADDAIERFRIRCPQCIVMVQVWLQEDAYVPLDTLRKITSSALSFIPHSRLLD